MAEDGFYISKADWPRFRAMLRAYEAGEFGSARRGTPRTGPPPRPNRIVLLLENLDAADEARAAVLEAEDEDAVQAVTIVGNVTGGTFRLRFDAGDEESEETEPIPCDATAEELQAAL